MAVRIRTVLGDVSPGEIQAVLPHEHTLLWEAQPPSAGPSGRPQTSSSRATGADTRDKRSLRDQWVAKESYTKQALPALLRRLRADFRELVRRGCNGFVDCNTIQGLRLAEVLCGCSRATGMHIVTATGFYVEETLPAWVKRASADELASRLMREVTEGVEGTEARAGAVKVSSNDYELRSVEKRIFRAAAAVHRKTGVPITTHSTKGARRHVEFLKKHGVDPSRVALGHIEVDPWGDIREVAGQGAMLLFTNFGGKDVVPEDMIIAQIRDLVRRGFVKQVMISVDMYLHYVRGRLRQRWPGGYLQIFDRVIPRLRRAGLRGRDIDRIVHENPCRHLAF